MKFLFEIPGYELQFFSCYQRIQGVVHEGQGRMDGDPLNHYHQNKLLPKKVVQQHPEIK